MPRIFDDIERQPLSALRHTLAYAERSDHCVDCFNLLGWLNIDAQGVQRQAQIGIKFRSVDVKPSSAFTFCYRLHRSEPRMATLRSTTCMPTI